MGKSKRRIKTPSCTSCPPNGESANGERLHDEAFQYVTIDQRGRGDETPNRPVGVSSVNSNERLEQMMEGLLSKFENVEQQRISLQNQVETLTAVVESMNIRNAQQNNDSGNASSNERTHEQNGLHMYVQNDQLQNQQPIWQESNSAPYENYHQTLSNARMNDRSYIHENAHVKVRPFNPNEIDWYNYEGYFEAIAAQSNWTENTKCAKLLGALPTSLTGVVTGLRTPFGYRELASRISSSQNVINSQDEARIKLTSMSKEPTESIAMFAEKVRQLTQRAYPHYTDEDKETHSLQAFIHGLSNNVDLVFQMRLQEFRTLQEANNFAMRVEQAVNTKKGDENKRSFSVRNVNVEESFTHTFTESMRKTVEEMRKVSDNLKKVFSPENKNDAKPFHSQNNNGVKRTVENSPCHYCGQFGHWKPQCPHINRKTCAGPMQNGNVNNGVYQPFSRPHVNRNINVGQFPNIGENQVTFQPLKATQPNGCNAANQMQDGLNIASAFQPSLNESRTPLWGKEVVQQL